MSHPYFNLANSISLSGIREIDDVDELDHLMIINSVKQGRKRKELSVSAHRDLDMPVPLRVICLVR